MVRKWSYLNLNESNYNIDSYNFISSIYNFKVFRSTTRFKKYNRSELTFMVRKKYSKRKHKTNWLRLSFITKHWMFFYFRNKQFIRFYQSTGLFNVQSYSTTSLVFNKNILNISNNGGLNISSVSNSILKLFYNKGKVSKYYSNPLYFNKTVFLSYIDYGSFNKVDEINPGLVAYDNLMYHNSFDSSINSLVVFFNVQNSIFNYLLKYVVELYKILILLTLRNI